MPPRVATEVIRETIGSIGAEGMGDFFSKCATDGVEKTVTTVIAGGLVAATPLLGYATLLLGPLLWEARRDGKAKRELEERLGEINRALAQAGGDAGATHDRLAAIAERNTWVWARLDGAEKAEIAQRVEERLDEGLRQLMIDHSRMTREEVANVRIVALDTNGRLRAVEGGIENIDKKLDRLLDQSERIDSLLRPIVDDYLHQRIDRLEGEKAALQQQNEGLRAQIEAALKRRIREGVEAGASVEETIRKLKREDPHRLLEFLEREIEQDESDLIEKHRERAAVAFVLGEISKAQRSLEVIRAMAPDDLDALNRLGHIALLQGRLDEAERSFIEVHDATTDQGWRAIARGSLGLIEGVRGNLDAAEDYHRRSLAIEKELGRKEGMASSLGNLGLIEQVRGNLDAAEDYLKRSLAINKDLGRKEGMANQLGNLGLIEQVRGNLDVAEDYHKRSLAIEKELGRKEGMASSLGNLGLIEGVRGNLDAAEDYHKRSLAIDEDLRRKEGMASSLGNLGLIEGVRGNLDAAEDYLKRSLAIDEDLGRKEGMANQLSNLGAIAGQRGDVAEARRLWTQALELFTQIGARDKVDLVQSWIDRLPPEE